MMSLRIVESLSELSATGWDALHDGSNLFVSHGFLSGLERHGCLREQWGWKPHHAAIFDGDTLIAAAPAYIKHNSHGEFVFDHAWAQAFSQHGLDYYPKWLVGVPYSPITGPRLLAKDEATRRSLLVAMLEHVRHSSLSSLHVNFLPETELVGFDDSWLTRGDVQFHWQNGDGWRGFDDFLAALERKKRKNIRQERQQVQRAGISFRIVHGDEASENDLADMHAFYCSTQAEKGNHPALTLDFVRHLARNMPRQLVLILATLAGKAIAGALCLRSGKSLYGRYWGASETLPGLHFETCYYQGIEYCLREGLIHFEPGAQGEHKIARGFLPILTHSRHYIADERFARALRPWCAQERASVLRYRDLVMQHNPYREIPADCPTRP